MSTEKPEQWTVGYYEPTERFRAIGCHVAVMRESDGGLIAVCGPAGDPESEREARQMADSLRLQRVNAALLQACRYAAGVGTAAPGKTRELLRRAILLAEEVPTG